MVPRQEGGNGEKTQPLKISNITTRKPLKLGFNGCTNGLYYSLRVCIQWLLVVILLKFNGCHFNGCTNALYYKTIEDGIQWLY